MRSPTAIAVLTLLIRLTAPSAAFAAEAFLAPVEDRPLAAVLLSSRGATDPVLLYDARRTEPVRRFLAAHRGTVRCFYRPRKAAVLARQMADLAGAPCERVDRLADLARRMSPDARDAIAALADDYPALLRAAAFAASTRSALLPLERGRPLPDPGRPGTALDTLYRFRLPSAVSRAAAPAAARTVDLDSDEALDREWLRRLAAAPPEAVVVANPGDVQGLFSPSGLSLLAPLLSARHRAPLLLVDGADPVSAERKVLAFVDAAGLRPRHVVLVADELALRSHILPDPVLAAGGPEARGGGRTLRVELFSEILHGRPQDLSVGRVVAEDATSASALLAAQRFHPSEPRPVVLLGNADEAFSLGEAISRTTVEEMRNLSVPVRASYREEVTSAVVLDALHEAGILVWEGHARDLTLEERGGVAARRAPPIAVLQGCYTFDRSDPFVLLESGTYAVVASSAAIYSAPGSAFSHALFDSLLYEDADLGTAVRNARNFVFGLSQVQRARNHPDWRKTYRAALAFSLWGDPTLRADLSPARPAKDPVSWTVADSAAVLDIPADTLPEVFSGRYRSRAAARTQFGGLVLTSHDGNQRRLKDLYYTVQRLPGELATACTPGAEWTVWSAYAPRSATLSLLARPDAGLVNRGSRSGPFRFPLVGANAPCPP